MCRRPICKPGCGYRRCCPGAYLGYNGVCLCDFQAVMDIQVSFCWSPVIISPDFLMQRENIANETTPIRR